MVRRTRFISLLLLLTLVSIGVSALPDLVITELIIEPEHPQAGQSVFIEATVSNLGYSAAEQPFFVHFFVDGREIAIRPIPGGLRPGDSRRVVAEWSAAIGQRTLSVEVDPRIGRIEESDETNNIRIRTIDVSLSHQTAAAIGSLKVAVLPFEDLTGSGFVRVGEGVADKLIEQLAAIGVRVLERFEIESIMQERGLNPSLMADVSMAGRLLGADVLITGSVSELEIRSVTLRVVFISVSGADVKVGMSARLVNVHTSEIMSIVPAEGHDQGVSGVSCDLTGLLSSLKAHYPDICSGGLQLARSWYNTGESIPIGYRNPSAPGWFSIEITTGAGHFVRWLGWQHIGTDDCSIWHWDQLNTAGLQMSPGIYSARLWDGTSYLATVGFQIRPGISLNIHPSANITIGTEQFEETVMGSAVNLAVDGLIAGLIPALEDASLRMAELRASLVGVPMIKAAEGQVAAILPDGRLVINIGSSSGVVHGDVFEVLSVVNIIMDPRTLEILDYEIVRIRGEIVVTEVRERVSFGVLRSDFEPAVGDIVRRTSH